MAGSAARRASTATEAQTHDFLIVGGGQAGIPLAHHLAKAGHRVALAERKDLGGSCVNFGCTPTKAVIASARAAFVARRGAVYGLRIPAVEVDFPAAGTYVVWVRGLGEGDEDNSCHVGLDGKAVATADKIADFTSGWSWVKSTKDGVDATLNLEAAGKRTLNVWMREDGFVIDRILLTTDNKFTPPGN